MKSIRRCLPLHPSFVGMESRKVVVCHGVQTLRGRVDEGKKVLTYPRGFLSGVWQGIVNGLTVQSTVDTVIRTLIITVQRI